jgi:hypothetical protein
MQTAPPELPPGPKIENLRGPIEATANAPWPIILTALILLAIAGGLFLRWFAARHKRNNERQVPSPCDAAREALQQAQQNDNDGTFAAQASHAVRVCLSAILPASIAATTTELASQLASNPQVKAHRIDQLLQSCDSVKFSGRSLSKEERSRILETAREIITEVRQATTVSEKKTAQT